MGQGPERALFRASALPTAAAGAVVTTVAALRGGAPGVYGAVFGTAVVMAFFGIGLLVSRAVARIAPELVMGIAMLTYALKVLALGGLLAAFRDTSAFSTSAFAGAVLVATVVWLAAQVRAFTRLPLLYVEPDTGPETAAHPDAQLRARR
ncbi:MAG: hypothetical protein M3P96_14950 [Actinomycetota bacterium]|nr:hypothetical protein [Actinomycetota bacterium]